MTKLKYKTREVCAAELLADDKFKIAGTMYIVLLTEMSYGRLSIVVEPLENTDTIITRYTLFVPTHMKFKIHNKK